MWEKVLGVLLRPGHPHRRALLRLMLGRPNVYINVSCCATKARYYARLRRALDGLNDEERATVRVRILFGTDFSVNLMWVESYSAFCGCSPRAEP